MKMSLVLSCFTLCFVISIGCQNEVAKTAKDTESEPMTNTSLVSSQTVEASCGQCQFDMQGTKGCDLAVRMDGKSYFVDEAKMDDHGDAHGDDGMCNCIRQAKVSGEVKDGRFVATSFELLPVEKTENGDKSKEGEHNHKDHDH